MNIAEKTVVLMDYTVKDEEGNTIDTSEGHEPLAFIVGTGSIIPGLEKQFIGKKKGDAFKATIKPEEGYGLKEDDLVESVPRAQFAAVKGLEVGMQLQAQTEDGVEVVTVVAVSETEVTIDANHPLAGKTLMFDVKVVDVREPTAEELAHGHVHGVGGHHH